MHDVLEILETPRQPVDAGDNQRVAGAQKLQQDVELRAALALRAGPLLGADHLAAGGAEGRLLQREVLITSGHAGVAVKVMERRFEPR
jgi:hypothetical protein